MRGLCEQWTDRHTAYVCVMSAVRAGALSLAELVHGNINFGLPTLARLLTLREIVRHGELMAPRNR